MTYKILSLDGGASWAMVQARVLLDMYGNISGHDLLKKFDLVIANSGGSVLLGMLCHNNHLEDIVHFYNNAERVSAVFPRLKFGERLLQQVLHRIFNIGAKYSVKRKMAGLEKAFGDTTNTPPLIDRYLDEFPAIIGHSSLQLIITAFDYNRERVAFFRSNKNSKADRFSGKYYRVTLGEAIHASCNAPINYYDGPAVVTRSLLNGPDVRKSWYWDGAVAGFNNPAVAGLVEAITNHPERDLRDFIMLSLGTGQCRNANLVEESTSSDPEEQEKFWQNRGRSFVDSKLSVKFLKDIKKMSGSILSDPPDSASFIAYAILTPSLNNDQATLVRINPHLCPEKIDGLFCCPRVYANAPGDFEKLMEMDFDIVKQEELDLINNMCDRFIVKSPTAAPCIANQLIRGEPGAAPQLGYDNYRQARDRWLYLSTDYPGSGAYC